jgi:hypothetical protein
MSSNDNKILIHDDEDNDVHIIDYHAVRQTLCGEHLNAISSTYISNEKIPVTCDCCLEIARDKGGA